MKARFVVLATLAVAVSTFARAEAQAASPAGTWTGTIATPGAPVAITMTLQRDEAGAWSGTLVIPAQGASLPLGSFEADGARISFRVMAGAGNPSATATLNADGSRLSGTFTQGGQSFPLELSRAAAGAVLPSPKRPQEPKRPFPYREEEVTYRNDRAQIRLAGTLTLPPAGGPFPAVVLITGSGAQDRDETIAGHKPFLLLSDYLTRRGFAVLRVDDRGVGGSELGPPAATTQDFADDVRAGVSYLKARKEVDAKRIGLIGHSEGANIAAIVAAGSPEIRFVVMMAGSGIPGDQLLYLQAAAVARLQGASPEVVAWDRTIREQVYELVKAERGVVDENQRKALLERVPAAPGAGNSVSARIMAQTLLKASSGPWFRYFIAYDPVPTLATVTCPVLALIGDNDVQVPAAENLPAIRRAFELGKNRDHTVMSLPRLNHLFQTSVTGAPTEYGTIEETIAPSALTVIGDWVAARAGK